MMINDEEKKSGARRNIFEPFAVFGIILGVGLITLRILPLFATYNHNSKVILIRVFWFIAAAASLIYSLLKMRAMLAGSLVDRFMYVFLNLLFVALGILAFYLY